MGGLWKSMIRVGFKDLVPAKPDPVFFMHYFAQLDEKTQTQKDFSLQMYRSRVIRDQNAKTRFSRSRVMRFIR